MQRLGFLLFAGVLALGSPLVHAQPGMAGAPITGLVIAEDSGEPVVGANVAVYQNDRFLTGAATDLDGRFSVSLRPGTYRVRVSFVGYDYVQQEDVAVRAGSETDLGTITLSPNAALLGEAQVVAEREFIEQQADRTVYNVQEQAVTAGGNALETLQTLPGLEVDTDGNVSLRGNQNVAIQINGRPVPVSGAFLAALLRQIPADRVDAVEVIPNPSARYEPDGMGGIINIRLAEGTDRGLSGGLTFGGGTQPNANIGANVSYQQGAWDLNAQYGFRFDENVTVSGSDLVLRDANGDIVTDRRQDGDSGNESTSHFLNGSATYSFFEGADLTFEGSLGLRDGLNENATQFEFFEGASDVLQRLSDAEQDGFNGDAALVFRRKFVGGGAAAQRSGGGGRPGGGFRGRGFGGPRGGGGTSTDHELAIETRYTFNQNDNLGCFADLGGIGSTGESGECYDLLSGGVLGLQRQDQDQTNAEASLQVDYTRPLGAAKLEIGARLSDERVTSDQVFSTDRPDPRGPRLDDFVVVTGQTNAFEYDRQIAAAYVQAARPIGPFQVQAGVRAEYAQRSFDLLTEAPDVPGLPPVADAPTELDYTNLFPSFFLTYPIGEGTLLKGSYSRRIDRPRTSALNPFPSFEDTTFVRVGNPGLTPEYTDSFELGFTYRYFLTVTPFYRRQTDALSRFVFTDPVTGNRAFTTVNFDTEESYGTEVTLLAQFGPVRGFVNTTVAQEVISGESDQESAEGLTWRASTSVQARLREGTNLQFFFFYRGPSNIVGGQREGFGFSSLGINQTISDRLSLSARVNDVFSTSRFEFETTTFGPNGQPNSEVASFFDPAIQAISATLTWTFGSGPQRQQRPDQQGGNDGGGFGDL